MMATTTEEYLADTTTEMPFTELLAAASSAAALSAEQPHHNQITFEIPSHHDLEHIKTMHTFNTLLQRIGNVAYDTVASSEHALTASTPQTIPFAMDAAGHHITNEQISKSVVLNLADLKNSATSGLERFFAGADMHSIINYLWIGVVTSLIVLSVIFIVFSCYFYRKFREWKKCNKDIRAHLNNDMYPGGTIVQCDSLLANATAEAAYYQMESPPCYTIATGLPTYDEALHHHQHYSFGMQFMYPTIAAVHHHTAASSVAADAAPELISNWEKADLTMKRKERLQRKQQQEQQQQCQMHLWHEQSCEEKEKCLKLVTYNDVAETAALAAAAFSPPAYDDVATTTCTGVDFEAASVALLAASANEKTEQSISICMEPLQQQTSSTAPASLTTTTTTTTHDVLAVTCSNVFIA